MELLREPVEAHALPVALGIGHSEVALNVLLGRSALLLGDDHDRPPRELRDAANDRGVIAEGTIAVKLLEAVKDAADDLDRVRARDIARGLHRLPRGGPAGRELRRVGDESRLDGKVTVSFPGATGSNDAVEHGHASGASRESCADPRSDGDACESRDAALQAPAQVLARDAERVQKEGD